MTDFFASTVDILMSLDPRGNIRYVNPSYERVTGHTPAEVAGNSCLSYVAEPDVRRTIAIIAQGVENDGFENLVRAKDGSFRVVSWRGKPASDGNLCAIGRDVTSQRAADDRRLAGHRLDAVMQLTGGIAHDFKNILASMLGYLEIGMRVTAEERTRTIFKKALDCGRTGTKLVEQMLAAARQQQLKVEKVELGGLLLRMSEALGSAVRPLARVSYELDPLPMFVEIDAAQMQVAITNLCLNSMEAFQGKGGHIALATSPMQVEAGATGRYAGLQPGRYAHLCVQDDGPGMPEAAVARCFEPFYTTRGVTHGRGLGLPFVHGVVAQCGGTTWIDSLPGQGTAVHILLPLKD
nr:ATP-binding protein [Ramlibacter humi]